MVSIQSLIQSSPERLNILRVVATLDLPDCYVAAGFVRNMIWDYLHGFDHSPLNDIDVIYFDKSESISAVEIQSRLSNLIPVVSWEAKNQASMHLRNKDAPYSSSLDAMRYWPEKETAVGVRLSSDDYKIEVAAPFGTSSLFSGLVTHNPKRQKSIFEHRVKSKGWKERWPNLEIVL